MKNLIFWASRRELFFDDTKMQVFPKGFFQEYELIRVATINLKSCLILNPIDFNYFINLTKLHIVCPALQQISEFTFGTLILLENLYFQAMSIPDLPKHVFRNLRNLRKLILIVNQVETIDQQMFKQNYNLNDLRITFKCSNFDFLNTRSFCNLEVIKITNSSTGVLTAYYQPFKIFPNLQILSLSNTDYMDFGLYKHLKHFQLINCYIWGDNFLDNFGNLTYLEIKNCTLFYNLDLNCDPIFKNVNLKTLILVGNLIEILNENFFNELKNLVYLDLNSCQIQTICNGFLGEASKSINVIKLHSNRLQRLKSGVFLNCKRVFSLDLSDNRLTILYRNVFDDLNNAIFLYLKDNMLGILPRKIFGNLHNLKYLSLSKNCFERIQSNWFNTDEYYFLETFDLSSNIIKCLDKKCFEMLSNLKFLNISKNRLSKLSTHLFENLECLTVLNLGYNKIGILKRNNFKNLKYLETLKLNFNDINEIEANTFDNLINLRLLDLSGNGLTQLPSNVFAKNLELRFIFLNDNILNSVSEDIFYDLVHLQVLHLINNRLETLSLRLFKKNVNLKTLYINQNLKRFLDNRLQLICITTNI